MIDIGAINARFRRDVREHAAFDAGVLIHQLDGLEDHNRRFSPCATPSTSPNCYEQRTRARRQRVSASIIFSGLQWRDDYIPTFSLDGGVILRPSTVRALCGYGTDGSIDDNKPLECGGYPFDGPCIPGCGSPPNWCTQENPHDEGAWLTCGLGWGGGGVRPWRPSEFGGPGGLLDLFRMHGDEFFGVGSFKGYNEIVVDAQHWIDELPLSVEGIFTVACQDGDDNLHYGGTAQNCGEARAVATEMYTQFLEAYHLSSVEFPLLELRPWDWENPFYPAA